jgi:hypothetical protein
VAHVPPTNLRDDIWSDNDYLRYNSLMLSGKLVATELPEILINFSFLMILVSDYLEIKVLRKIFEPKKTT